MDINRKEVIKKLQLQEKEGNIYLFLLEFGASTIAEITKSSKMGRTSVYLFIDKLIDQGFVTQIIKNRTKYYQSVNIDKIMQLQEEKIQELLSILRILKQISQTRKSKP